MGQFEFWVLTALYYGALALTLWAFVDALIRPAPGFVAAGKLTKPGWAAITGIAAVVVYLVDVRPAVRGLRRGNSW